MFIKSYIFFLEYILLSYIKFVYFDDFGNEISITDEQIKELVNLASGGEEGFVEWLSTLITGDTAWPRITAVRNHWFYEDFTFDYGKGATIEQTITYTPDGEDDPLADIASNITLAATISNSYYQLSDPNPEGPNENIKKLQPREAQYVINNEVTEQKEEKAPDVITESMQVTQGKLVIGLDIHENKENARFIASVYNAILGGGANSKLFQNVREKQSLAYTANSSYVRTKNSIFIRSRN